MGKIYYLIGKSSTGKDSFLEALLKDPALHLQKIVQYTTRPQRDGEQEGREYHFITDQEADEMDRAGKIVEIRTYHTIHGPWRYMLADDGSILSGGPRIAVGTVESYVKVRSYFGAENVVPLYIWVETGERLERALQRERNHDNPKYAEMCRRFLADEEDFSDEKLKEAGLMNAEGEYLCGYENADFETCLNDLRRVILRDEQGKAPAGTETAEGLQNGTASGAEVSGSQQIFASSGTAPKAGTQSTHTKDGNHGS